jgi:transcriptional regulator with XRE-family HTH domain
MIMVLKIKDFREQNNLSIDQVAVQLGISNKDYVKIEKGIKDIKLSKLEKLAKILGVKKSDLF